MRAIKGFGKRQEVEKFRHKKTPRDKTHEKFGDH